MNVLCHSSPKEKDEADIQALISVSALDTPSQTGKKVVKHQENVGK